MRIIHPKHETGDCMIEIVGGGNMFGPDDSSLTIRKTRSRKPSIEVKLTIGDLYYLRSKIDAIIDLSGED